MLNRRQFIQTAAGAALLAGGGRALRAEETARKAPFRLLYGNDTTNICECTSPYHRRGEGFRPEMLEASVDEAVGADAQLLQPGLIWVPLWKSAVYPADAHFRWWQQTFQGALHPMGEYMLAGGDVVKVFVDRCRARKVAAFVSVRLNDYHRIESLDKPPGSKLDPFDSLAMDRFRREHAEWRLVPPTGGKRGAGGGAAYEQVFAAREGQVMNWAQPEVRARIFAFITELAENYDLDGLELDFLRHFRLFRLEETTREQRAQIITDFAIQVRGLLDRTTAAGRHRWLGVRVPALLALHDPLGIEVGALTRAGVEIFNLSSDYYTVQQDLDLAAMRTLAPTAALYLEMTHTTVVGADPTRKSGDSTRYRRTTPEQFTTTAQLARARGADGVSLFNFAYYREYGRPERGPFNEPPFAVLPRLVDDRALANGPQHYFLAPAWRSIYGNEIQLPRRVAPGRAEVFALDLAPPAPGWREPGRLRIQGEQPLGKGRWQASLNGTALAATADVSEPYANLYPPMLGQPGELRAWVVPPELLRAGSNRVEVALEGGASVRIIFLDLALPVGTAAPPAAN